MTKLTDPIWPDTPTVGDLLLKCAKENPQVITTAFLTPHGERMDFRTTVTFHDIDPAEARNLLRDHGYDMKVPK